MRKLSVFRQVSWLRRNIHRSLVIIDTKDSQSFSQSTEIFPRCLSSIRPIRVFSALDDTYVRGVSRFKVNFKNVFVGPRRKSLPTARFCNPRTLICWQDGLKSVDPPVPPRDPLYFLRLSGKNPRNDARNPPPLEFSSLLRFRCFEGRTVLKRFSRSDRFRHVFDQRKEKDHRSSPIMCSSSTFLRFLFSRVPRVYVVTVLLIGSIAAWKPWGYPVAFDSGGRCKIGDLVCKGCSSGNGEYRWPCRWQRSRGRGGSQARTGGQGGRLLPVG